MPAFYAISGFETYFRHQNKTGKFTRPKLCDLELGSAPEELNSFVGFAETASTAVVDKQF